MIRFAKAKDLFDLNSYLEVFHIKLTKEEFETHPFTKYIIAKDNKKVTGFLCFEEIYERYELDYIYVDEKYRERGTGSLLMDFFIKEVRKKDGKNITLELSKNNKAAAALYKKYGFKFAAERKKYYGNTDGELLMRKM